MRGRLAMAGVLAMLVVAAPARADHAEAVRLFEEGRKQRDAGQYDRALQTFERSLREEQSVGGYLNLALLLEQVGRYRESYDAFQLGRELAVSKGDEREKDLREGQAKLLDTRNHIQLAVPADVKSAEGVRIVVDDIEVPPKQYDGYVFRAPSRHEVVVFARGRETVRLTANNRQLLAVSLGAIDPGGGDATLAPPTGSDSTSGGWPTKKWVGAAMMGAGVAAGVVGLVVNLDFLAKRSRFESAFQEACAGRRDPTDPLPECGSPQALPSGENRDAKMIREQAEDNDTKASIVLPIAYVSAAALFGVGLYFFLSAPSATTTDTSTARITITPKVGARDGGLWISGSF